MTKVRQLQVTIDLELMLVDSEFDTENLGAILAVLAKEYLEDFSCLGEATKKAVVASPKSLEAADNTEDVMEVEMADPPGMDLDESPQFSNNEQDPARFGFGGLCCCN